MSLDTLIRGFGLWRPIELFLLALPWWGIIFVGLAPLVLVAGAALFIELRLLPLAKQYAGIWPGGLLMGASLGFLMLSLAQYPPEQINPFWRSTLWDVLVWIAVFLVVVPFAIFEYQAALCDKRNPRAYTLYQLHTPTCLANRVAMFFIVYVIMKIAIPVVVMGVLHPWFLVGAGVAFAMWVLCIVMDNLQPRPYLGNIHPYRRAWFGWL